MLIQYNAQINGIDYLVEILNDREVRINGVHHQIDFQALRQKLTYSLLVDGKSFETNIYLENEIWEVILRGQRYSVRVEDERERRLRLAAGEQNIPHGKLIIHAPMPGLVIDIPVNLGDHVSEGDVLLILESMKMQNELTAPREGKITDIHISKNQNVDRQQPLIILD